MKKNSIERKSNDASPPRKDVAPKLISAKSKDLTSKKSVLKKGR